MHRVRKDRRNRFRQQMPRAATKRRTRGPMPASRLQLLSSARYETRVPVKGDVDIMTARQRGWELATRLGFSPSEATLIAAITSGLARNIICGSDQGEIILSVLENGARRGIEVAARHEGAGLSDIERSAHKKLRIPRGRDLVRVGKLVDEFAVISEPDYGSTVTVKKWMP